MVEFIEKTGWFSIRMSCGGVMKGKDVEVGVELPSPSSGYADLLRRNVKEEFESTVVAIRREEYERGWKHAEAKEKKATNFFGHFRTVWGDLR